MTRRRRGALESSKDEGRREEVRGRGRGKREEKKEGDIPEK
jgi:hypothetical protein